MKFRAAKIYSCHGFNFKWQMSFCRAVRSNEKQDRVKQTLPEEVPAIAGMKTISCRNYSGGKEEISYNTQVLLYKIKLFLL